MKKNYLFCFFGVSLIILPSIVIAGNGKPDGTVLQTKVNTWIQNNNELRFTENKGQMADMQHKADIDLLFKANAKGLDIYITKTGLSYVFIKTEHLKKNVRPSVGKDLDEDDSIVEQYCRTDMELVGATILKENIVKEEESKDRKDYYLGGICPDGALNVHSYGKITIKNIYPGIDWVLYTESSKLKYDFIVHPGADPSIIKLRYKWADKPIIQEDGTLKVGALMGNITEGSPQCFAGDNKEEIRANYIIENNEVHFNIDNYNAKETLTIDPILTWATYYSGSNINDVASMNEDGTNVWVTGGTQSIGGYPTFNPGGGAYFQGTIGGSGVNAFILQFDTAGVLIWSTYYGGLENEVGTSIYSDGINVWVTGQSTSTNLPIFNPGGGTYFQNTLGGAQGNAFILEFNTKGVREWATYFGGNGGSFWGGDIGNSIYSDGVNVWVTGSTTSTNFPTMNPGGGAYFQSTLSGVSGNSFILKFSSTGILKWATYYGGNGGGTNGNGDRGYAIQSDGANVWVTGFTNSTNFPTLNPGGGAFFQGSASSTYYNAFLLQFNNTGLLKWATYCGGNGAYGDYGNSIQSDGSNVWVTGSTTSTNFPTMNPGNGAFFQGTLGSKKGNAFILKFTTSDSLKWGTYFGGSGVSGDLGYSIQNDGKSIWVCGATTSPDFPVFNSGCGTFYQDTAGNTINATQDIFISQFAKSGVLKWSTYFGVDNENDGSFAWSDGTNLFVGADVCATNTAFGYNATPDYPTVDPGNGAYYFPSLVGYEDVFVAKFCIACEYAAITVSPSVVICSGSSTTLTASGAVLYSWSPSIGLSSTDITTPVASPTVTTTYKLIACDQTDSVTVTVDDCSGLYVPNVFTPNGDNKNDLLSIDPAELQNYNIEIFDRWGLKVFESNNPANPWNGKYNGIGAMQSDGVYYYIITGNYDNNQGYRKEGYVQLLK